jgi:hypothetical protein
MATKVRRHSRSTAQRLGGVQLANTVTLKEVFESWPLYRPFRCESDATPDEIAIRCSKCKAVQRWSRIAGAYAGSGSSFRWVVYRCNNCGANHAFVAVTVESGSGGYVVTKIGQYPPLEEDVPVGLRALLTKEDVDLYKKALRSRNYNFGLGALSYLRRVVENRMNQFLDLIAEAAGPSGQAAEIERVKQSRVFDDKVKFAARLLPTHLRPGGVNPIDALHDVASEGLHALTEEECIERFDRVRFAFEYLFQRLQVEKEQADEFVKGMQTLRTPRKREVAAVDAVPASTGNVAAPEKPE